MDKNLMELPGMKNLFAGSQKIVIIMISVLVLNCCKSDSIEEKVAWPEFLSEQDLIWDFMPTRWENAPFLGNGLIGNLICVSPDSTSLNIVLSRSDVGKLDFPGGFRVPMRTQVGSLKMKVKGKILVQESKARMDLWNAEASGVLQTTLGALSWRCYVPTGEVGIIFEIHQENSRIEYDWYPDLVKGGILKTVDGTHVYVVRDSLHHIRSDTKSGGFCVAWKQSPEKGNSPCKLVITIGSSLINRNQWEKESSSISAEEEAVASLKRLLRKDQRNLVKEHREWWHTYYTRSFLSLPDRELESFYWIQMYKLGCTTRECMPMIDNHGVWSVEPVFGFATWDLNVQVTYRMHLAGNHPEMGKPLVQFLQRNFNPETMWSEEHQELRAGIKQQTFLRYRFFDTEYWEHDPRKPGDGPGKFLWGCHNYWLQYKHTCDTSLLQPLYYMLAGGVNSILAIMEEDKDGYLNIPWGQSWETKSGRNTNCLLAIVKWSLETMLEIEESVSIVPKYQKNWKAILDRIAEFQKDEIYGYLLAENLPPVSHRHWSHLLMVFPLHTVTWDNPSKQEIIKKSIDLWTDLSAGLRDEHPNSGYASIGALCLYASIGETKPLLKCLQTYFYSEHEYWQQRRPTVWANTMYREFGPVVETPLFTASAIQYLVLQSWGGKIRVFPAVPEEWKELVFYNMHAQDGFLVSGRRENGQTSFIRITSLEGKKCVLRTDLKPPYATRKNDHHRLIVLDDGEIEINLQKGESIILFTEGTNPHFTIEQVAEQKGQPNPFGLNERFLCNRPYFQAYIDDPEKGK